MHLYVLHNQKKFAFLGQATEPKESKSGPAINSILCKNCEGNGMYSSYELIEE